METSAKTDRRSFLLDRQFLMLFVQIGNDIFKERYDPFQVMGAHFSYSAVSTLDSSKNGFGPSKVGQSSPLPRLQLP